MHIIPIGTSLFFQNGKQSIALYFGIDSCLCILRSCATTCQKHQGKLSTMYGAPSPQRLISCSLSAFIRVHTMLAAGALCSMVPLDTGSKPELRLVGL